MFADMRRVRDVKRRLLGADRPPNVLEYVRMGETSPFRNVRLLRIKSVSPTAVQAAGRNGVSIRAPRTWCSAFLRRHLARLFAALDAKSPSQPEWDVSEAECRSSLADRRST